MSRVQFITTPSGERLAIMPAEDYETLANRADDQASDAADLARIDEILVATAGSRASALSSAGMKRLLADENPVRVWREERGLSQKELASRAGIVASEVSMIETGKRTGTVTTLKKLARVLGVDLADIAA